MVNTETAGQQRHIKVAVGPAGSFVCVWDDDPYQNSQLHSVFYRAFFPDGAEHLPATKAFPLVRYFRPAVTYQFKPMDPGRPSLTEMREEWTRRELPDNFMARDFGL